MPDDKTEYKYLHIHELEEYSKDGIMLTLKGVKLICSRCHSIKHLGFAASGGFDNRLKQQANEVIDEIFLAESENKKNELIKKMKRFKIRNT